MSDRANLYLFQNSRFWGLLKTCILTCKHRCLFLPGQSIRSRFLSHGQWEVYGCCKCWGRYVCYVVKVLFIFYRLNATQKLFCVWTVKIFVLNKFYLKYLTEINPHFEKFSRIEVVSNRFVVCVSMSKNGWDNEFHFAINICLVTSMSNELLLSSRCFLIPAMFSSIWKVRFILIPVKV